MLRKFKSGIHFGDSSDEEDDDVITFDNFDPQKQDIMMLPFAVKLITPYLLYRFPELVQFLRYDLKNYPAVMLKENAPYPYPFLEVYNMKGLLLDEVDLSCRSRAQLNSLLQRYQQTPKHSLQWLTPPERPSLVPNPDVGDQYRPGLFPESGLSNERRISEISSVRTNFTVSTPDTVITE